MPLPDRIPVQRIELVRAVDGDDADGTIVGYEEVGVGHILRGLCDPGSHKAGPRAGMTAANVSSKIAGVAR